MATIRKNPASAATADKALERRRLLPVQRERQIVDGAVRFFSVHGLGGQLRDLARSLGITHTLLYHYFPTKQALLERVYADLFAGRWRPQWEGLLDDRALDAPTKLSRFYTEYAQLILERDWVRVFVFSGLSDRFITDRYFALLGEKLFPRLVRESRRHIGNTSRAKPSAREMELVMGLHGSIFYMGLRRWVYGLEPLSAKAEPFDETYIRDRVHGYLQSFEEIHSGAPIQKSAYPFRAKSTKEIASWPMH